MKKILTREEFEYIKRKSSEGVLAVDLEEELGYSAYTISLWIDKYPTWEDYEARKEKSREWWHNHQRSHEKRRKWYRERGSQLRKKRRLENLDEIREKERERYRRRLQDPEYAAKEKIRGSENWRRFNERKEAK